VLTKRSFTLAGHRTSVALEVEFWDVLQSMADTSGATLASLIAAIDADRGDTQTLASALRLAALRRSIAKPAD